MPKSMAIRSFYGIIAKGVVVFTGEFTVTIVVMVLDQSCVCKPLKFIFGQAPMGIQREEVVVLRRVDRAYMLLWILLEPGRIENTSKGSDSFFFAAPQEGCG
jgi:hypothetical protein